jgi:hypothetical protein
MTTFPGGEMPHFPIEWHVVDEDRGRIVCEVFNQMRDPGDGEGHGASTALTVRRRRPDRPPDRQRPRSASLQVRASRGAACRNRTDDLFITSESLYRLS